MTDRPDSELPGNSPLDTQPLRDGDAVQDFEIQRAELTESAEAWSPEEDSESRRGLWIGLLLALAVIILAVGWWLRRDAAELPPQIGTSPTPAVELPTADPDVPDEAEGLDFGDVPELGESDVWMRQAASLLSSHPKLADWLLNEDLVRSGVKVVSNIAFDEDPRVHVPYLRPRGKFEPGAGTTASPRSFARYDMLAEVFSSLDPEGAAELLRRVGPRAEEAYTELGYPGSFDQALSAALRKLSDVPVLEEPPRLVKKTLSYHYANEELEALAPAQKLLLRMGSANTLKVQSQIDQISDAWNISRFRTLGRTCRPSLLFIFENTQGPPLGDANRLASERRPGATTSTDFSRPPPMRDALPRCEPLRCPECAL